MTAASVATLAALVGGRVLGDAERRIVGLGDLRTAGPDQLGFVRHPSYAPAAATTRAGALLLAESLQTEAAQILVDDVDIAYAKIASYFHPRPQATRPERHPTAVVDPAAEIEEPVVIGPRAVLGRCRIGAGSVIMAGAVIGDGAVLGRHCVVYPNATLYHGVLLGERVTVHANAVIGSDGFGYAHEGTNWLKVPQLGSVLIEDDVEIGAGTAIDRGTIGNTRIGARSKIDNLCHIAHNCNLGTDFVMAAGGLIAGSSRFGDRCTVAGAVSVGGHLTVGDDVRIGGGSAVIRDVPAPGDYMGYPLMEKRQWLRTLHHLRQLAERDEDEET